MKIMVTDDNRDAADTLAMMLRLKGYEVKACYLGSEAIALAEVFLPDVAILDIGMPEMDGYQTCRILRKQPWGRNIAIFALTGYGQEDDVRKSDEAGFDEHLLKPVDLTFLLACINKKR
jgi:CheY-like chemotaxis protein